MLALDELVAVELSAVVGGDRIEPRRVTPDELEHRSVCFERCACFHLVNQYEARLLLDESHDAGLGVPIQP